MASAAAAPAQVSAPAQLPADEEAAAGLSEHEARRADLLWAAGITLASVLLFVLLNVSGTAAVPVLVALFIAYALDPIIDWFEARKLSRTLGIVVLVAAVLVALAGFLLYLVPAVWGELQKVPEFLRAIAQKALPRIEGLIGQRLPDNVRDAAAALGQQGGGLAEKALPKIAEVALGAIGGTASLLVAIVGLLVIPVLTFYMLRDYDRLVASARGLLPRRYERLASARFAEVDAVLSSFIRGQLTVGAILTCIYGAGLSAARLDLAFVIGAVAGFGNMIPYVGPAIGFGLAALSLAVSWQGPWQIAAVAATFAVGMGAEGLFITPRVLGEKVGLPALAVMIAILVFGELFGFVGILLAVPVTAVMKVVVRVVLMRYRRSKLFQGMA
ncbi:MAG: AI-2E family transporter [Myxococcales bacterium]|jgi:predicted PurR-regulated permease PerM